MAKSIKIFKSFEEQEMYFLEYFFALNPSERLKALAELQRKNYKNFISSTFPKKITIKKEIPNGHRE